MFPGPVLSLQYLFSPLFCDLVKSSKCRIGDQLYVEAKCLELGVRKWEQDLKWGGGAHSLLTPESICLCVTDPASSCQRMTLGAGESPRRQFGTSSQLKLGFKMLNKLIFK